MFVALRVFTTSEAALPADQHVHVKNEVMENDSAAVRVEKRRDLESVIGGSWFNWIGIIAPTMN